MLVEKYVTRSFRLQIYAPLLNVNVKLCNKSYLLQCIIIFAFMRRYLIARIYICCMLFIFPHFTVIKIICIQFFQCNNALIVYLCQCYKCNFKSDFINILLKDHMVNFVIKLKIKYIFLFIKMAGLISIGCGTRCFKFNTAILYPSENRKGSSEFPHLKCGGFCIYNSL